eukprot:8840993-Lingulodinium_polyedra.AAC.1
MCRNPVVLWRVLRPQLGAAILAVVGVEYDIAGGVWDGFCGSKSYTLFAARCLRAIAFILTPARRMI